MALNAGKILTSILPRQTGQIARVTISRPSKLNSLNTHLLTQLPSTLHSIYTKHKDLIGIILTGDGDKAFIGGADILEMGQLKSPEQARAFIKKVNEACTAVRDVPVPVIARTNGYALGAGLEMAACCDVRVAARSAGFAMPEVRVGVPSVVEAALLPRLIGWGRTKQLLLFGETISADEALKWGLVENVVPDEQLDDAVEEWIQQLEMNGPLAVRRQKELIRKWEEQPLFDKRVKAGIKSFGEAFTRPKHGDDVSEPERLMGEFKRKKEQAKKARDAIL